MDELIAQQTIVKDKIVQFESNYNKDGKSRKTKAYLETRIEKLKELYTEFVKTDEQIYNFVPPINKNHPYSNERTTTATIYKKLIEEMRQLLNTAPPLTPTLTSSQNYTTPEEDESIKNPEAQNKIPTDQSSNSTLNQLLRRQDFKIRELYRDIAKAKDVLEGKRGKQAIQFTIQCMQRTMNQIIDRHEELCVEASDEDHERLEYFTRGDYEALKEEYTSMAIQMTSAIEENTTKSDSEMGIKLKPIEIPVFSGDYMKWGSFAEIFNKLIDQNQRLSNTHKINYLKSNLDGAAAKLVCHLESTADNYEKAWSILNNRYNNKKAIISAYLNTLLNQPTIANESSSAIRIMHDTTTECLHAIKNFGINVESWNTFLIFILLKKLDNETRRLYETSQNNPCEFQETTEFLKFLEQRFKTLETSYSNRSYIQTTRNQPV